MDCLRVLPAALCIAAGAALAQAPFPNRPVTTIVGFAPGGGTDTVSRIIAKTLGEQLGQQVLTDNKSGAGGNIATDFVVRAAPDGHTIYLANVGAIAVNPHLLPLAYDPLKDLAPISMAVVFPNLVVVHPSVPADSFATVCDSVTVLAAPDSWASTRWTRSRSPEPASTERTGPSVGTRTERACGPMLK